MLSALLGGGTKTTQRLSQDIVQGWWPTWGRTSSGQIVNCETAPRVPAVLACVRVLSETFASAPCITYRRKRGGGKDRATELGIYSVLHDQPNQWQTAFEFWEMLLVHLALRGNFYALIVPGTKGAVTELIPLNPDRVKVQRLQNGRLRYVFTDPETGKQDKFAQDEIFHVRGMSIDGMVGVSIITYQRELIGSSMASGAYQSSFFGNDATPGVILTTEQPLTPEARKETRDAWDSRHRGAGNRGRTAVLSNGLKASQLSVNNSDAQFLELRGYDDSKIASVFRVPPHLIGIMDRATYSNIEQQSLEFIMYTMLPWFRRVEAAISRDLLVDPETVVEFLVDGLLRGDIQSRYNAYATGRNNGWINGNEIRSLENMNDMGPEGDVYLIQGAMVPIDRVINQPPPPTPSLPAPVPPAEQEESDSENGSESDASLRMILENMESLCASVTEIKQEVHVVRESELAVVKQSHELESEKLQEQIEETRRELAAAANEQARLLAELSTTAEQRDRTVEGVAELRTKYEEATSAIVTETTKLNALVKGLKSLAAEELRGLIRVEVNAMQRASSKHEFLTAVDRFYGDHEERIAVSMKPVLSLLASAGGPQHNAKDIAKTHRKRSYDELLEAAGMATAKDLPEVISTLMANWEQRADFLENDE